MEVSCRLMQEGIVLEEAEIPLMANGQEALYIEEMFTRTDTSDFVGSVRCMVPSGGGGRGCSPPGSWKWTPAPVPSSLCGCFRFQRCRLGNKRGECPDSPRRASGHE